MRFRLLSLMLVTALAATYFSIALRLLGRYESHQMDAEIAILGVATGVGMVNPAVWLAILVAIRWQAGK